MATMESGDLQEDMQKLSAAQQAQYGIKEHVRLLERLAKEDEEVVVMAVLPDGGQYRVMEVGTQPPAFLSLTVQGGKPGTLTSVLVPYGNVWFLFEVVKLTPGKEKVPLGFQGIPQAPSA